MLAPEPTITSFLWLHRGCGRQNPLIGKRIECSFVRFFGAKRNSWQVFTRLRVRIALVFRSLPEIGPQISRRRDCAGGNFDLYFIQRWTFAFSDVCSTQRSSCESYLSIWSQNLRAIPRNRYRFWRLNVLHYATQLSHIFHNSYCTNVTTLLGFFVGCSSTFQCGNEHSAPNLHPVSDIFKTDIREDANSHKVISYKFLSRSFCTAVSWTSQTGFCV